MVERLRLGMLAPALLLAIAGGPCDAAIVAVDDAGRSLSFEHPPARVVTLAPSLTELVFAAGAGAAIVATTALSDYPPAARSIARVGDATRLDVERLVALRPDLVIVWRTGNTMREIDQLEAAGLRVFRLEPQRLDDVPRAIERLGLLLGHQEQARAEAQALRTRLAELRRRPGAAAPVRVFYQVWSSPLLTINRQQIVSDVIELCGGGNVFAGLAPLVPQVSIEAVLAADPEAIVSADEHGGTESLRRGADTAAFAMWQPYRSLSAIKGRWLYTLNGDAISRPGPSIADGAAAMCQALDQVRQERAALPQR